MKVTIEQINGVPHTIIWHEWLAEGKPECLQDLGSYSLLSSFLAYNLVGYIILNSTGEAVATALPPLPRNPKPIKYTNCYSSSDARLIELYRAHGLLVCCKAGSGSLINGILDPKVYYGFYELDGYRQSGTFHFREIESNSGDWGYNIREITYALDEHYNQIEIAIKE